MTNFERIKRMSVEEMAAFLKSMVDENETHEIACYGCINYGTHHSKPENKGTNLYECEGCTCDGIGHDLIKWLNKAVDDAPAVDAVEVVRCKDCKFWQSGVCYRAEQLYLFTDANHYCGYAEKEGN